MSRKNPLNIANKANHHKKDDGNNLACHKFHSFFIWIYFWIAKKCFMNKFTLNIQIRWKYWTLNNCQHVQMRLNRKFTVIISYFQFFPLSFHSASIVSQQSIKFTKWRHEKRRSSIADLIYGFQCRLKVAIVWERKN